MHLLPVVLPLLFHVLFHALLPAVVRSARADDAVTMEYVKHGQTGTVVPGLTLHVNQDAATLDVQVNCGGKSGNHSGPARAGEAINFLFDLPVGQYACKGSLSGEFADGTAGEMPLSFGVQVWPPMKIQIVPESVDLKGRTASVKLDRTASKVEVTAVGARGVEAGKGTIISMAPAGQAIAVNWSEPTTEPIKLRIRGFDEHNFWTDLNVSVWSYNIPHEDVVFATSSSTIDDTEVYKLDSALIEATKVYTKYEGEVTVRLYVSGHTDTVGDAAMNQKLSGERALSIARWFKAHGFPGEIWYCGMGESDLAVPTKDSVDEARNRRAVYILAGSNPGGGYEQLK
jgi:outer membrane protein OmpA-like peptidoglycan-associated protein